MTTRLTEKQWKKVKKEVKDRFRPVILKVDVTRWDEEPYREGVYDMIDQIVEEGILKELENES